MYRLLLIVWITRWLLAIPLRLAGSRVVAMAAIVIWFAIAVNIDGEASPDLFWVCVGIGLAWWFSRHLAPIIRPGELPVNRRRVKERKITLPVVAVVAPSTRAPDVATTLGRLSPQLRATLGPPVIPNVPKTVSPGLSPAPAAP